MRRLLCPDLVLRETLILAHSFVEREEAEEPRASMQVLFMAQEAEAAQAVAPFALSRLEIFRSQAFQPMVATEATVRMTMVERLLNAVEMEVEAEVAPSGFKVSKR
jgi:hypothetical protein